MKHFEVRTPSRECLVDVTERIAAAVAEAGAREGVCTVFVPHTTAAITINENADSDVARDLVESLRELVPQSPRFRHAEGNSDAHVKASLLGSSVQVPVQGGRLALGTWQGIYLAEFDGPRLRRVSVVVLGS